MVGITFRVIFPSCMNDKTLTANQNPSEFTGRLVQNVRGRSREMIYRTSLFISADGLIVKAIAIFTGLGLDEVLYRTVPGLPKIVYKVLGNICIMESHSLVVTYFTLFGKSHPKKTSFSKCSHLSC